MPLLVCRVLTVLLLFCAVFVPISTAQQSLTREEWVAAGWPVYLIPVTDSTKQWPDQYDPSLCRFLDDMSSQLIDQTSKKEDDQSLTSEKPGALIRKLPKKSLTALLKFARTCAWLAADFSQYGDSEQSESTRILRAASEQAKMRRNPPLDPEELRQALDKTFLAWNGKTKEKSQTPQQKINTLAAQSSQRLREIVATEDVLIDILDRFDQLADANEVIGQIESEQMRRLKDWLATEIESEQKLTAGWKDAYFKLQKYVSTTEEYVKLLEEQNLQVPRTALRSGPNWATLLAGINSTLTEIQRTRERQEVEQQQRWQNYHLWVIGDELRKRNLPPF